MALHLLGREFCRGGESLRQISEPRGLVTLAREGEGWEKPRVTGRFAGLSIISFPPPNSVKTLSTISSWVVVKLRERERER